ncbi:MAG: VWA domain-containing protein [Lachnospiraceae bacterium]|nr:VWA domain-containing protein [Lachnospiraceae bacterium]
MKTKSRVKRISMMIIITMLICAVFTQNRSLAGSFDENGGMDVVIVVDTSGSMRQTDSERIAVEAAKLFVDMMETSGSQVGLVSFSDSLGTVLGMTQIESLADKDFIKDSINGLKYAGDTDIGLALKKAYDILQINAKNSNNKKAILFLTDGKIDLPKGVDRKDADSLNDSLEVLEKAKNDGIPIYSIGLNADGNVDQQLITKLSQETNGRKYVVDSADELPDIFNEIFADFINSNIISLGDFVTDGKKSTVIPFEIPNNSVLEANLILLSDQKLQGVSVIGPSGADELKAGNNVYLVESSKYSLIKLITPPKGKWTLEVSGKKGCKVHVNLIFNYKVELKSKVDLVENGGKFINVESWLKREGQKLDDQDIYSAFTGKAYVTDSNGNKQAFDMQLSGSSFTTSIPADSYSGTVTVYSRVDGETMYRESEPVTLNLSAVPSPTPEPTKAPNRSPEITNIPDKLEMSGLFAMLGGEKFDIEDCIIDPDNDPVTVSVEADPSDGSIITADANAKRISIKPKANGNGKVKITAVDPSGASASFVTEVEVDYTFKTIIPLVGGAAGLILLALLAMALKKRHDIMNRPLFGSIEWELEGHRGSGGEKDLSYEKGYVKLGDMIQMTETNDFDLYKVTINMNKDNSGLEVVNKSSKCKLMIGFSADPKKNGVVLAEDSFTLSGTYNGEEVALVVTYYDK